MGKTLSEYKAARDAYLRDMRANELKSLRGDGELPVEHNELYNIFQGMREDARHRLYSHIYQGCITFLAIAVPLMNVGDGKSTGRLICFSLSASFAMCGIACGIVLLYRTIRISNTGLSWLEMKAKSGAPYHGGEVRSEDRKIERIAMKLVCWTLPLAIICLLVAMFI